MSIFRNQMSDEEKQGFETLKSACPICGSDVKGNEEYHYFCPKCSILYRREDLILSREHIESIMKQKIAEKLQKEPIIIDEEKTITPKKPKLILEKKIYYFASKHSNIVHASNCPYGKNIKKENRIRFNSLDDAAKYKRCKCVG